MDISYISHCQIIPKSIDILNRLTSTLPSHVKVMNYNELILSKFNYGVLTWGYESEIILKLQKKAVRIITSAKYNAHTEPINKKLSLSKIYDLFSIIILIIISNLVTSSFHQYDFKMNNEAHHYSTRISTKLHVSKVKNSFALEALH